MRNYIDLDHLKEITANPIPGLGTRSTISLGGLTELDNEAALLLAMHNGNIYLAGLKELDDAIISILTSSKTLEKISCYNVKKLSKEGLAMVTLDRRFEVAADCNIPKKDLIIENQFAEHSITEDDLAVDNKLTAEGDCHGIASATLYIKSQGHLGIDTLHSITPGAAKILVTANFPLVLDTLTSITPQIAQILANHQFHLSLNGIGKLDGSVEEILANRKGSLSLNKLRTVQVDWSRHYGKLSLNGLHPLTAEIAHKLHMHPGPVEMETPREITREVADILEKDCAVGPFILTNASSDDIRYSCRLLKNSRLVIPSLKEKIWKITNLGIEDSHAIREHGIQYDLSELETIEEGALELLLKNQFHRSNTNPFIDEEKISLHFRFPVLKYTTPSFLLEIHRAINLKYFSRVTIEIPPPIIDPSEIAKIKHKKNKSILNRWHTEGFQEIQISCKALNRHQAFLLAQLESKKLTIDGVAEIDFPTWNLLRQYRGNLSLNSLRSLPAKANNPLNIDIYSENEIHLIEELQELPRSADATLSLNSVKDLPLHDNFPFNGTWMKVSLLGITELSGHTAQSLSCIDFGLILDGITQITPELEEILHNKYRSVVSLCGIRSIEERHVSLILNSANEVRLGIESPATLKGQLSKVNCKTLKLPKIKIKSPYISGFDHEMFDGFNGILFLPFSRGALSAAYNVPAVFFGTPEDCGDCFSNYPREHTFESMVNSSNIWSTVGTAPRLEGINLLKERIGRYSSFFEMSIECD